MPPVPTIEAPPIPVRTLPAPRRRPVLGRLRHFGLFAAPGVTVYLCFVLAPIAVSLGYSFTNANPFNPPTRFTGLHNYTLLMHDPEFWTALRVTTILTLIVTIVPNVAGLGIALLLDRRGKFYNALRGVFFTPVILSSVVVSIVWSRLLDEDGPVNEALRALGWQDPPGWLSDPSYA